ncbi:hypothetical protein L484_025090 [Morus notabilis]|uniref:SMP domain-containing protein n=1 Tax=Morus notabilis TaxID=981085 RepID=W9QVP4_9ROSA|nr:hypothetical protein L484_025090 [Morus notabilis]
MSQGQPQRPRDDQLSEQEPIKNGDVFNVSGSLASKPVAPRDAAAMQAAESMAFLGRHERAVQPLSGDATNVAREQGATVSEKIVEGTRVITEAVGGQVVGEYVEPQVRARTLGGVLDRDAITIGEALEATALSVPDKPVDHLGDAAAIQAAEVRATGINLTLPGGVGATAQSAATFNAQLIADEYMTTISDVIGDATQKLPADKAVTREDAQGVIGAEVRNKPDMSTTPGGVAASMAAAARLNNENK